MANRMICDVLDELRKCNSTRNYSYMIALVEEAQTLANRMEAALWNQKDVEHTRKEHKRLKEEIKQLKAEKKKLT